MSRGAGGNLCEGGAASLTQESSRMSLCRSFPTPSLLGRSHRFFTAHESIAECLFPTFTKQHSELMPGGGVLGIIYNCQIKKRVTL